MKIKKEDNVDLLKRKSFSGMTEWAVNTTQDLYSGSEQLRRTLMLNIFQIISFHPQSIILELLKTNY